MRGGGDESSSTFARGDLRRRVTELRAQAFELLDEMSAQGLDRHPGLHSTVSDMLDAANSLGRIEAALDGAERAAAVPLTLAKESAPRSASVPLSQDAAIVLTLASTSLPFASSIEDEAERWLRVLRLHGEVGAALQAIGVAEAPLETAAEPRKADGGLAGRSRSAADRVGEVNAGARELARRRDSERVATLDVLFAVLSVYDRAFDRALYIRGASREELLERLPSATALSD
jgi:hypothetical protein